MGVRIARILGVTACCAVVGLSAGAARADNPFLNFLRGDWLRGGSAPSQAGPSRENSRGGGFYGRGGNTAGQVAPDDGSYPGEDAGTAGAAAAPAMGGGAFAYCVRTCDGRFFPISGTGGDRQAAQSSCQAFCPSAEMQVFSSSSRETGIDRAVSSDGRPYTSLPNAYAYRTSVNPACTCTGTSPFGLAAIPIDSDPTLRPGDYVMAENGPLVFQGRPEVPHAPTDFVSASDGAGLSRATRKDLEALQMAIRPAGIGR
ncbi:DUF2865 domain-containing protein [Ancylobacter lacus]|uniref:DUF2865 domain-containing protein n=1 Tax=Ancylobacter lacus TaxID=2579970 RepID=UPI001BD11CE9|nr:DUF2865 domain-containing protein [Ancylobacter lacus]MBS7537458.1 DUF2865 domain-containing protein [Ancylobacter lacus]